MTARVMRSDVAERVRYAAVKKRSRSSPTMHIPRHGLMGGSMFGRSEPGLLLEGRTRDLAMFNLAIDIADATSSP